MKEIQAYVRPRPLAHIIERLQQEGARGLTVTHVDAIGALADSEDNCLQRLHRYRNQHADIAKVEIVCPDAEVDRFVSVLREASCTGELGDGRIFVLDIKRAINIHTGEEGAKSL